MATDRAAASLVLGILLLVLSPVMVVVGQEEEEELIAGRKGDDCLYERREACTRADMLGCVWCDLPRRCYTAARSLELGEFCTRKKLKAFVEVSVCDDILDQHRCQRADGCLWCRSEAVDDGCFSEIEAVRLPRHIFTCPPASSSSAGTTVAVDFSM